MITDRQNILSDFDAITLEEMNDIRLMNRIDTKYLLSENILKELLKKAMRDYRIQEVKGEREIDYQTIYLDTPSKSMYLAHLCGRAVREKIRVRTYVSSDLTFFEVKNKSNKGRTDKKRIRVSSAYTLEEEGAQEFLRKYGRYQLGELSLQLENRFKRITLVNRDLTERLTIDRHICFRNLTNMGEVTMEQLVVVELKRNGRVHSSVNDILHDLHVHPAGFSKYCMGCALTDTSLRQNRFKPRIGKITSIK